MITHECILLFNIQFSFAEQPLAWHTSKPRFRRRQVFIAAYVQICKSVSNVPADENPAEDGFHYETQSMKH